MQKVLLETDNTDQISQNQQQQDQPLTQEVKLLDGVYFTDYRTQSQQDKTNNIKQLQESPYIQQMLRCQNPKKKKYVATEITNALLLEQDFKDFQNEIKHFDQSIDEIYEEEYYEDDKEFVEAIQDNFAVIDNYFQNMLDILQALIGLNAAPIQELQVRIKEVNEQKTQNLKKEQKFYIHLEEYKRQKTIELHQQLEQQEQNKQIQNENNDKENNEKENNEKENENDEGIYI